MSLQPAEMGKYRLRDLARITGQNPRTIRSWIDKGLLRGPDSLGRSARYDEDHLVRVRAIAALRDDHDMGLDAIGALLERMGRAELLRLVETPPSDRNLEPATGGARDLLRSTPVWAQSGRADARWLLSRSTTSGRDAAEAVRPLDLAPEAEQVLRRALQSATPERKSPPSSRRKIERWLEIPVTRTVHLRVRDTGREDEEQRARQLAGRLRKIIDED